MDYVKIFAKNEKELKTLCQTKIIYIQDWGMEFGIGKSSILIMFRGNRGTAKGKKIEYQEIYKYKGILELDLIR